MNDRERWNKKYSLGSHTATGPSQTVLDLEPHLPRTGRAFEIAGGAGRHAIWLAQRGLNVTLADVSDVGLQIARDRAHAADCELNFLQIDLQVQPFPPGPWDLILSVHFLWRPLLAQAAGALVKGGKLVVIQPTLTNLQRHEKPPAPFLLRDGELPTLVPDLNVEHYQEGWLSEGRHEAVFVASA